MKTRFASILPVVAALCGSSALGSTLVYESFTGYTAGLMRGQTAAAGTGLEGAYGGNGVPASAGPPVVAASGSYSNGTFVTGGLTFGSLPTSGGALTIAGGTTVVGVKLSSTTSTYTGTLWTSFLVRFNSAHNTAATGNAGAEVRLTSESDSNSTNAKFRTYSDSRVDGNTTIGVDYNSTDFNSVGSSSAILANGTTYLMISSFTNVGTANGGGGVATTWAMTQAQYEAMMASPKGPEAFLAEATAADYFGMATTSDTEKATDTFDNASYLQLISTSNNVTYDEIRYGTSLLDVVPEPSHALLGVVGAAMMLVRRRRNG